MNVSIKEIHPNVYLCLFDRRYELCMTFVRIQEFYESPKYRGKYFELEEFMDWWATEYGNGSFDYPGRWNGFNIPGKVLINWMDALLINNGKERDVETVFLNKLSYVIAKKPDDLNSYKNLFKKTYIIGVHSEDGEMPKYTIDHELAHAFYYLYPQYKKSCKKLLSNLSLKTRTASTTELKKMGYDRYVIEDELQAYYSTSENKLFKMLNKKESFSNNFRKFKDSFKV